MEYHHCNTHAPCCGSDGCTQEKNCVRSVSYTHLDVYKRQALDATHKLSLGYLETVFTLGLPQPISFFFLACISLYFLCIVLRVNPYLGILAGLAYAYSTYDPVIIMVGHVTKMASMAYAPAVLASLLLLLQKKYWTGSALLMMFSFLMISQNHVQLSLIHI